MENVIYSKQVQNAAEEMGARNITLYLTQESNGWAIWLIDTTHYLVAFFHPLRRNEAIETAVRLGRRPFDEIVKDAIQFYP